MSAVGVVAQADTETPTPTETATPTETLTPSPTLTATPELYQIVATLPADGQPGAVYYTITAGEAAIVGVLLFESSILLGILYLLMRQPR